MHSPVWNFFIAGVQWLADTLGVSEPTVVHASGIFAAIVCAALVAGRWQDPRWSALAGTATALSAASLRPFEEYPTAKLLLLLTWLASQSPRRATRTLVFVPLGWLALMLHLSGWFLLAPALLAAFLTRRDRSDAPALGVLLAVFVAGLFPSILDVFATGAGRVDWESSGWRALTVEWTNPLLFAPLALLLLPRVRAAAPHAASLALGLIGFTAVTFWLMWGGLAIGGHYDAPGPRLHVEHHHYFELVEPLLVIAGFSTLHAWGRTSGPGRALVLAGLLTLTQAAWWAYGWRVLS